MNSLIEYRGIRPYLESTLKILITERGSEMAK
jgi:hypothetical protein